MLMPVLGLIAFGAVGVCVYMMQSRMDEMAHKMKEHEVRSPADSADMPSSQLSEEHKEDIRKITNITDNFCAYLDSIKNIYINNGGVASIPEKVFSARMQRACTAMLEPVKDTAARTRLEKQQFCAFATAAQVRPLTGRSPMAAVIMYLEKTETDCREFEKQVIAEIEAH